MAQPADSTVDEARRAFLFAYHEGKLEELRLQIGRRHTVESARVTLQGNLRAVKDGAFSPRVIECLHSGSLSQWREMLQTIRRARDKRKSTKPRGRPL